jgi:hypothetical protein
VKESWRRIHNEKLHNDLINTIRSFRTSLLRLV